MTDEWGFWIFVGVCFLALLIIGYVAVLVIFGFLLERGVSLNSAKTRWEKYCILAAAVSAQIIVAIASRIALWRTYFAAKGEPPHQ